VSSSGLLQLQNPVQNTETMGGGVGASAFTASSTESNLWDLLIGVPVSSAASVSALTGSYRFAGYDYTNGDVTQVRDYTFLATADGKGGLGSPSVTGTAANLGSNSTSQTITNAAYSASGSAFTFTFPAPSGATPQSQLLLGSKQFGMSSDGNVLIGGSLSGYDLIVGIRGATSGSNAAFNGIYYAGGVDDDTSQQSSGSNYLDAYYGSIHATGTGTLLSHQRVNPSNTAPYDYSYDDEFSVASNGTVSEAPYDNFYIASNGQTGVLVGLGSLYSLEFWVSAATVPQTGPVVLNPLGVVNVANYDPITASVAPGEYLALYGTNLSAAPIQASGAPFSFSLGNTTVSVSGVAAPIYYASPTEVVIVVPWGVAGDNYAQIVVTNAGAQSNPVTLYLSDTSPGMFTVAQNGIGPGSITHANGALVTTANPARPGETVVAYASGLGTATPLPADGAASGGNPPSSTDSAVDVFVGGTETPSVAFSGLSPNYVGLYQINFVVPSGVSGQVYCDIATDSAVISQAIIAVGNAAALRPEVSVPQGRRLSPLARHPLLHLGERRSHTLAR
jgi:uncharacterized protein (TIGR03437 family)